MLKIVVTPPPPPYELHKVGEFPFAAHVVVLLTRLAGQATSAYVDSTTA